jgi:hypothetical protein
MLCLWNNLVSDIIMFKNSAMHLLTVSNKFSYQKMVNILYIWMYKWCLGTGTVPDTGAGTGTGYNIFKKFKVRVR